tara:strand:- start:239 stop:490 length:252 start_codon:yes stop_codon:yes gene_type:complete
MIYIYKYILEICKYFTYNIYRNNGDDLSEKLLKNEYIEMEENYKYLDSDSDYNYDKEKNTLTIEEYINKIKDINYNKMNECKN